MASTYAPRYDCCMTRIAVADLMGDDLNIAVAFADGHRVRRSEIALAPGIHEQWPGGNWEWIRKPSTAWEHGGPIIERERMALDGPSSFRVETNIHNSWS